MASDHGVGGSTPSRRAVNFLAASMYVFIAMREFIKESIVDIGDSLLSVLDPKTLAVEDLLKRRIIYDYTSPDRTIFGKISNTVFPLSFVNQNIEIPIGTPYFEINFVVKASYERDPFEIMDEKNRHQVLEYLTIGSKAYIDFLQSLKSEKKLGKIDLVIGTTNKRMARLATNRLGFHLIGYDHEMDHICPAGCMIGAYKNELISRMPEVSSVLEILTGRSKRLKAS